MFGMLGGSNALYGNTHDPQKERPAPPLPTPISFPDTTSISKKKQPVSWTSESHPNLFQQYAQVRRPTDITSAHLEALNTRFESINIIEDIIPESSFVPSQSWLAPAQPESSIQTGSQQPQSRVLSNGRPYPTQADFYTRSKELQHKNKDAFGALSRRGVAPLPRLAHFRKFWEGLDNMAYYWDTSSDEYIPAKAEDNARLDSNAALDSADDSSPSASDSEDIAADNSELEPRKRTKPNPNEGIAAEESIAPDETITPDVASRPVPNATSSSSTSTARTKPPEMPRGGKGSDLPARRVPEGTYRGNRIGNGAGMPDMHRLDTIRSFVEPIAWAFGFTIAGHRRQTALSINKLLIPIKLSSVIWRPPTVREKARAGWLEGPVMGISCRAETEFAEGRSDAVIDTLREIGAMLLLAQERGREGRAEVKPGEDQWWTTKPRWGGGPGEDPESPPPPTVPSSGGEVVAEQVPSTINAKELSDGRGRGRALTGMARRKLSAVESWKVLKQGAGLWDPRVEYKRIGAPESGEYDEVFLVSSLNHHISILKLTVHKAYLEYLHCGSLPPTTIDSKWCNPVVHRSRWYDLFDIEDRLEAMRGIWGVMGYLARTTPTKE